MPVYFNEPLSFTQRIVEDIEYVDLLHKAAGRVSTAVCISPGTILYHWCCSCINWTIDVYYCCTYVVQLCRRFPHWRFCNCRSITCHFLTILPSSPPLPPPLLPTPPYSSPPLLSFPPLLSSPPSFSSPPSPPPLPRPFSLQRLTTGTCVLLI